MTEKNKRLNHYCFPQPSNELQKVWRYLDLAKFLNLISTNNLHFSRVDLLNDVYEGSLPKKFYIARENIEKVIRSLEPGKDRSLRMRKSFYVNCWRIDDFESEAMWKLYCPNNDGIAIQTTYQRLVDSITDDDEVYIGLVRYIDYEEYEASTMKGIAGDLMGNAFAPIMHKRKAFEHEKEVRLVKALMEYWNDKSKESTEEGIDIPWGFNNTIETVFVNPYSPEWYYETVKNLLTHYNLDIKIEWSSLKTKPFF